MIPKKIHYCWFGGKELSKSAQKCIASWRKYCPDYEIIEWNEDNFNLDYNEYTRYCYDNQKWAYLSDLARLVVIEEHGGIYFDTDVEVVASFDDILKNEAFFAFENDRNVATGLGFGSVAGHETIRAMIEQYQLLKPNTNGEFDCINCPLLNTQALISLGLKLDGNLQTVAGAVILPTDYMNPYDNNTGRLNKTKNTLSIHWYTKSALSKKEIWISNLTRPFHRLFGENCFELLKRTRKE